MENKHNEEIAQKKKKLIKGFLIKSAILYVIWLIAYHGYIEPDGKLNDWLTNKVIQGTVIGLNLIGFNAEGDGNIVSVDGQPVVRVEDACNGLELFALYAGFLICFPGAIKYKAIFIPLGVAAIFFINIGREIVLALNYKFFQETFDFNHKYTYVLVVYLAVFAIWRYWLNHFSALKKT